MNYEGFRQLSYNVADQKAALYVNVGDHKNVWDDLKKALPKMAPYCKEYMDCWEDSKTFAEKALTGNVIGIHAFYHSNIFEAVYCSNLLMRDNTAIYPDFDARIYLLKEEP